MRQFSSMFLSKIQDLLLGPSEDSSHTYPSFTTSSLRGLRKSKMLICNFCTLKLAFMKLLFLIYPINLFFFLLIWTNNASISLPVRLGVSLSQASIFNSKE